MFLLWRTNLADQNKQQPLKTNIRVTYHTFLSVWNKPLIDTCQHCWTNQAQVFKIEGFVWKRFLPSPPPPPPPSPTFIFRLLFHFSRGQYRESRVPRSSFAPKPNGNACYAGYRKPAELTFWHWQRAQMSLAVFLPFFCSVSSTKKSRN